MQGLNQLETLKLPNCVIELGVGIEEDFKAKLKSLVLKEATFVETEPNNYHSVDFMSFIARTCPELYNLTIQDQFQDQSKSFKIEFPRRYFTSINIDITNIDCYKVYNENQISWYEFEGRALQGFSHKKPNLLDRSYVFIVYEGFTSLNIKDNNILNW